MIPAIRRDQEATIPIPRKLGIFLGRDGHFVIFCPRWYHDSAGNTYRNVAPRRPPSVVVIDIIIIRGMQGTSPPAR